MDRRHALLLVVLIIFPLIMLVLASGVQAQTPESDPVLLSNTGQAAGSNLATAAGRDFHAQSFTTGKHPDGYFLTSVEVGLGAAAGVTAEVTLWRSGREIIRVRNLNGSIDGAGNFDHPEERLMTFTPPSAIDGDASTLERFSTNDVLLLPDTVYWVVVTRTAGAEDGLSTATASSPGAVDAGGLAGFSLGNKVWLNTGDDDFWRNTGTFSAAYHDAVDASMRISLRGSPATRPPGPYTTNRNHQPWAAAAETGSSASRYAIAFEPRTRGVHGSGARTFELTSVLLSVAAEPGVTPRVAIHANKRGSPESSPLTNGTLTAPADVSRVLGSPSRAEFTADTPITLNANTTYWVVLDVGSGSGKLSVGTTADDGVDDLVHGTGTFVYPWEVNSPMKAYNGSAWSGDSDGRSFRMALNGTTSIAVRENLPIGLAQVGVGVVAQIVDLNGRVRNESWQWQRGETSDGTFVDIPAEQGGASGVYVPAAADLGKWLKATVSYDDPFGTRRSLSAVSNQPVLSRPSVSTAGRHQVIGYVLSSPDTVNIAQAFTTGGEPSGYVLGALRFGMDVDATTTAISWTLYADDGGKPAATPLFDSVDVPPDDLDRSRFTFEELAHPGFVLAPNTRYWVVVTASPLDEAVEDEGGEDEEVEDEEGEDEEGEDEEGEDEEVEAEVNLAAVAEWGEGVRIDVPAAKLDPGSQPGWSLDVPALTSLTNLTAPKWEEHMHAVEVDGISVLRMSVVTHPVVTASFGATTYSVAESDDANTPAVNESQATVTVSLSADPERTVTIPITKTNQGGATDADYSGVPENVVFNAGETSKTFTFTAAQDSVDDDGESVKLAFGTILPPGVSAGTVAETTVSITDDDHPKVEVEFAQPSYNVDEGGTVTVTVSLSADPERMVSVPITTANQGGATDADYSGVPESVTFTAGEREKTFTFTAAQDSVDDDGESVKLAFGTTLPPGVSAGTVAEAIVSITDDDTAGVSVSTTRLDIDEGDLDTYTVVLDSQPAGDVTVAIGGVDGTDLSLDKASLTFTSGNWDTPQTVTVTAGHDADAVDEAAVTVTHTVSSADDTDYNGVTADSVVVTVDDDETASLELTLTMPAPVHGDTDQDGKVNLGDTLTYTATATNSGNVTLENVNVKDALVDTGGADCVSLDIGAACALTVAYTIAQADVDAGKIANTATASATGAAERTATRETEVDQVEGLTLEKTATAAGFDGAGESLSYSYKVTNTGTVTLSGTIEIVDDKIQSGDVTCPAVPAGGLAPGAFLSCAGSYTTAQADVDAGKVTNRASASLGGVTSAEDSVTVNWRASQGTQPQLTVSSGEVGEDAGSFTFTVTLNPSSLQTVTVAYATSDGSATSGTDYTSTSGTLAFSPGATGESVSVAITDDDLDEADETFTITLTDAVNAGIQTASGTATITDDDAAGVSLSTTGLEIEEGDSDTYTVALTSEPAGDVTVAIGGVDGTELSLDKVSLTFTSADWDTAQTVTVTAGHDDDAVDEAAVTVTHTVSSADDDYNGVTADSVVVTVDDDEVPVAVSFGADAYTVDEGQTVTVTVSLDDDPERTVSVPVTKSEEGGASSADYSGVPSTLTFNTGETSQTFSFAAAQDSVDDDGESVKLAFGTTLPPGVSAGTVAETTVNITDDDTAGVSVSTTSLEMEEGDLDTYTVVLDSQPAGDVTVAIGGVDGTDLSLDKASLTFTSGNWDTPQTVTVTAGHDDDAVDEAAVTVTHTVSSADDTDYNGVTADSVVVTVDDDEVPVAVNFGADAYAVDEGQTVTVTVSLDDDPERTVTVPITKSEEGGASDADYSGVPGSVTFNAGEREKTFTFTAAADDVDDDGESVKLAFGTTLPPGVSAGTVAETTVNITDDDTAGVSVSTTSLEMEEGDSDTYTVALTSEPAGDVTVAIGGVDGTDLSLDKASLTFTSGNWDTPQTVTVTAGHDADAVDEAAVTVTHTVSSADDTDYNGVTADSVVVTVDDDETASLELTLTMPAPVHGDTDQDGKVNLGDTLTYTATATNSGNVTLENVNVKDALVDTGGADCVSLDIGAACALTVAYTIAQADVDAGKIANTATASATGAAERTATRETEVDQVEGLTLEKTATAAGFDGAGESLSYSYKVTNTGTVTLSGTIEIVDDKIQSGDVTCPAVPAGGLAPGAFLSCAGSYTTAQADVDAGKVTNRASASLGGVTSAEDSVTVNWRASQGTQPQLTVSSGEVGEDAGSFTFTVTLNPSSLQTVTVAYATSDGSATSGTDYTSTSGTLAFSPGATGESVSVAITDDDLDEADETFTITLTDAVNAGIQTASGTATITDDDAAGVSLSTTSLEIEEGDLDTYTVALTSEPAGDVTVAIGGVDGTDLSLDKASLTFTSGNWDTPQTVTVTAGHDDDAVDEAAVTVTHTVSSADDTDYNGVTADSVVVTVDDDEVPVEVEFAQSSYTVDEGGTVTVTVALSDDPERTVTVPITKSEEGGASDADYSGVPGSVTFNAGEREKTFTFTAAADDVDDDGESVKLAFGTTLPPGVSAGTVAETTVNITDDDTAGVSVSTTSLEMEEGDLGTYTVALTSEPAGDVTVAIGGVAGTDLSLDKISLTFTPGNWDTAQTVTVTAGHDDDAVDEAAVTVTHTVSSDDDAGYNGVTADSVVVTVVDDEVPVEVEFAQSSYTVDEGQTVTVTVSLDDDPERTVTVPITKTNQAGATGADYSGVPESVTFNAGEREKTFTFTAAQDSVDDDGESVKLAFGTTLPPGVSAGTVAEATVSITDDDTAGVSVSTTELEIEEGDLDTYTVVLDSQPAGDVTVAIGGVAGTELSLDKLSLTFTPADWDTEQTLTVTAGHDADAVDEAAVTITHTVSSDDDTGYNGVTADSVVVTVHDDEVPVAVSFGADAYTVDEGGTVTVTVALDDDPERTVTVPITKSEEGGASDADYSGVPESVTFNAGEREKTFTFTAAQDSVDDGGESVKLAFGATLPPGVSAGTVAEAVVSITDDDDPQVTVTDDNVPSVSVEFAQSSYSLSEGGTVPVKVALNADPERAVTIPLTITNQNGATDSDYSGVPESVTFASGERDRTFLFSAAADDIDEDDESVNLGFGTLPAGMSSGSVAQTTVNIRECEGGGIWCGTLDFGVRHQRSDGRKRLLRIYNNQMGELDQIAELDYDLFFYNGITYKVGNIGSRPSPSFWGTPGPPFNIPERASFVFNLTNLDGADELARFTMPNEDYLDWILYVSAEVDGETLEAELPFSEGKPCCDHLWRWYGLDLEKLNLAWEEGKLYRLRIVEDPRAEREPAVLGPPLYLRVTGYNQNNVILAWVRPQIRNDGAPPGVSYKIQWKETSGSWDTPADVSETMLELPPNKVSSRWEVLSRTISGLKWGIPYEARVIAVNEAGDSEPSNVVTFPKQPEPSGSLLYPQSATVDGATLVLTFDRTLDDNVSLPTSAFTVTVGGEPRPVSAVSVSGSTVTLTLASPVAAGETVAVDYERPDGPDFIRDNQGAEASSFIDWSVTNNTAESQEADTDTEPQQEATPLTAVFQNILASHDGSSQFRIRILFSEDIGISYKTLRDHVLTVTGGNVVNAGRVDGRNDLWTVIIDPDGDGGVTIVLPITEDCDAQGAICTGDGRMLSTGLEVTVNGPELTANLESGSELTASVESVPDSHNGSDAFSIRIALSEEPEEDFSYVTMRDYVFTVTGGSVTGARHLAPPGNMRWEITVTPDSNGDVTIVLLPTTDCDALGAVCTGDGRMLSSAISLLVPGPSTPATGAPAISGTAQAGQTLTADTSGIGDADGMEDAAFEYQWLADGAEIDGATNNAYALTDADVGKVFRVRVSFTDDNGNRETLTSQPTDAVAPRSPLAASVHDNPSSHDGQTGFTFELRFSEEPDVSFKTLRDHAFTVTGGDVTQARQLEQGSNLRWEITVEPTGDAAVTVTLPITTDCSSQGAICTGDGRMLSESVELTVAGPGSEERAANTPATGAPAMEGTARVGETLTAATKNIADADGMANATFSYQWLADDAAIGGATSGSYTLADADEGKAITVRVEFTDDAGNEESLTSEPTAAVAARPNRPATGAPTISGTAQVERTLTADTSDINDADGLTDASYNYQWLRNDGTSDADIGGATGATYTLVDADERKTIKVRVSFTDDRGHQETLMSAATGAVAAAPSPLTASIHSAPPSHDAQSAITFELRFSEEPGEDFSYVTLRDHAFTVTGGVVVGARRLDPPSNVGWEISVSPDSNGDVTIVLPVTEDCDDQGAICTGDGRMLSNRLEITVPGPDG